MEKLEIEEASAKELIEAIIKNAEAHNVVTQNFMDSFEFYGQTLSYWLADVAVEIPKDLTTVSLRDSLIVCGRKIQKATYFYTIANTMANAVNNGSDIKKNDVMAALVEHYNTSNAKRPGVAVLERLADSYMGDTKQNRIAAKILRDFWKDRRDSLVEVRKVLEQIGMSMHVEIKYMET